MPFMNKPNRPEQTPEQTNDLAAQLRAAQQHPVRPAGAPNPTPQKPADPYQEKMAKMEAAMKARQAANQQAAQGRPAQPEAAPQRPVQPMQPQRPAQPANQQEVSELLAREAAVAKAREEAEKARAAAQSVKERAMQEIEAASAAAAAPEAEEEPAPAPKPPAKIDNSTLRDYLLDFVGQTVRIQTSDHESTSGRLELVAEDWVKIVNMRSAGTEYFADEDIVSISQIVKVRAARPVDKETYNQFMCW